MRQFDTIRHYSTYQVSQVGCVVRQMVGSCNCLLSVASWVCSATDGRCAQVVTLEGWGLAQGEPLRRAYGPVECEACDRR